MNPTGQALVSLLHRKYSAIHAIEAEHRIYGHEGDYRPRIDYYHDAVRALGGDHDDGLSRDSRLSVERIAYDLEMLRLISARPLQAGRGEQHFSTSDALAHPGEGGFEHRPDRPTRQALKQHYKDYTVYFAALLAEKADHNLQARQEEAGLLIEDCAMLESLLQALMQGRTSVADVISQANTMEHDGLRHYILQVMHQGAPAPSALQGAITATQGARQQLQQEVKQLGAAGMRVSSHQLMVYEESREVVKSMASQGLNIAGQFTEKAVQQSQGQGRSGPQR